MRIDGSGSMSPAGTVEVGSSVALAIHPSGQVLYAVHPGTLTIPGSVTAYRIDADTGALQPFGSPVATELSPRAIQVHPSGAFAYVNNNQSGTVSIYDIDAESDELSSPRRSVVGPASVAMAMDLTGALLFLTLRNDSLVRSFSVNTVTGALTLIDGAGAGLGPDGVAVSPSGKFVYVANSVWDNVSIHAVAPGTGVLGDATYVEAGNGPSSIVVDPAGRFAYVANTVGRTISAYIVDSNTGLLSSEVTTSMNGEPISLAVDATGQILLAADRTENLVSMFAIDQVTGVLNPIGIPVGAGAIPARVSIVSFPN